MNDGLLYSTGYSCRNGWMDLLMLNNMKNHFCAFLSLYVCAIDSKLKMQYIETQYGQTRRATRACRYLLIVMDKFNE